MKIILQDNNYFVLRFDRGEEIFSSLTKFLEEQNITAASFSGIGACDELVVSYFDLATKTYPRKEIKEELEILSLNGNASIHEGKPALHIHGVFSRKELNALGGHVFKIVISATCEIFLTKLQGKMERGLNPELNINLLI